MRDVYFPVQPLVNCLEKPTSWSVTGEHYKPPALRAPVVLFRMAPLVVEGRAGLGSELMGRSIVVLVAEAGMFM